MPVPSPTWMWKPRSKLNSDEHTGTSTFGSGILGGIRSIGGDTWQRRYVFFDPTTKHISYGKGPSQIDKSYPLDSLRIVEFLSSSQMLELRCPAAVAENGWSMGDGVKEITWACEDAETRAAWVAFLQAEIRNRTPNEQQQQPSRSHRSATLTPSSAALERNGPPIRSKSFLSLDPLTKPIASLAMRFGVTRGGSFASTKPSLSNCTLQVSPLQSQQGGSNPVFQFDLYRKTDDALLYSLTHSWNECEAFASMVRSINPKVELPSIPARLTGGELIGTRTTFLQKLCEAAMDSPSLFRLPEVHQFVGFAQYADQYEHALRAGSTSPKLRGKSRSPADLAGSFSAIPLSGTLRRGGGDASDAESSHSGLNNTLSPRAAAQEKRLEVEQCFRIIDEAGSGYVAAEDIQGFLEALYPLSGGGGGSAANASNTVHPEGIGGSANTTPQFPLEVIKVIEKCNKANDGAYSSKAFIDAVGMISKAAKVPIEQWLAQYRRKWFSDIYAGFATMPSPSVSQGGGLNGTFNGGTHSFNGGRKNSSPTGSGSSAQKGRFDNDALLTLKYVVTEAGLRILSDTELERYRQADVTYTQTLDDFLELMKILSEVISLEDLLKTLVRAKQHSGQQKLSVMLSKKAAEPWTAEIATRMRQKMTELNAARFKVREGGNSLDTKCGNCEATEARLRSLRATNGELELEKDELLEAVAELETELDTAADALDAKNDEIGNLRLELAAARGELQRAKAREENLAARLIAADAEVKKLTHTRDTQLAANEGDVTTHSSLYFLAPMSFGSSKSAPVVDLPGALVYNLPEDFRPLGISMDIYLTGATTSAGNEYLSCRDATGRRSIGWQLSPDGVLTVPGTLQTLSVPVKQWTRIQARVSWQDGRFDLYLNGTVAMSRIPVRDEGVGSIAVLDVYPRHDVVVCYANMNFFAN